jgi:subtilase family serine protease
MAQRDRIADAIDRNKTVLVQGHLQPLAKAEFDRGAVAEGFALKGMMVTVKRTASQQQDLDQLLADQQNPSSPNYHKWLTPEDFANRFGASPHDLAVLRQWLESQGVTVKAEARSRTFLRFDATAAQVHSAFGAEIHRYSVNGVSHYAPVSEPSVPAALAPLVQSIGGLDDFGPQPHHVRIPKRSASAVPNYTPDGGVTQAISPADLATIYDITPLVPGNGGSLPAGYSGDGNLQTVVIIGASDVTVTDLTLYRSTFGLAAGAALQVVHPDAAPGITGDGWTTEATLDLELVSAVAPAAQLILDTDACIYCAVADAIDNARGQIISMSFGAPETSVNNRFALETSLQEANAQGITLVASSGDTGAAAGDTGMIANGGAQNGLAVNLPAAYPEVTGVGGTEFSDASGTYWSASNGTNGRTALSYIPEVAWNDSIFTLAAATPTLAASGGGVSTQFAQPSWQAGLGDPSGRNVPDVALAAAGIHDGYVIALNGALSTAGKAPYTVGGTSAAAPVFAGIVALLNQYLGVGPSEGNINPALYAIAAGSKGSTAFHDITSGSNIVPCVSGTAGCPGSAPYQYGYSAGAGYDEATGLGSVDAYVLAGAWETNQGWAPQGFSLSPSAQVAGAGSAITVALNGYLGTSRFTSQCTVNWTLNGVTTTLASSYIDANHMTASVPAALLSTPGSASIRVVSPTGVTSAPVTFTITTPPALLITSLSPVSTTAGAVSDLTLTMGVSGVATTDTFTVNWTSSATGQTTALGTGWCNSTSLFVDVPAALLATPGFARITIVRGGVTSAPVWFSVVSSSPTATIASLSPASVTAGGSAFALTVSGSGFATGAHIYWAGSPVTTTFVSSTKLTAAISASLIASAGTPPVAVSNADGTMSASKSFSINPTKATIASLSPASAAAGSYAFTLTVNGTNFYYGSTVKWGSTALATTYVSATQLTAAVTSTQLASAASVSLTVANPGGAASAATAFVVGAPAIQELNPTSAVAGSSPFMLEVTGTNFVSTSQIMWGTTALPTMYGGGMLMAQITSTQLNAAGAVNVTVKNASTASSAASVFHVNAPAIAALSQSTAAAGSSDITLTITGTNFIAGAGSGSNFVAGSTVNLGATALALTAGTATSITATVPAALLASAASLKVTVQNPGGVVSAPAILAVSASKISSLSPATAVAGADAFTLTVTGTNFVSGSTVMWGTTALATTYGSATSLTAAVTSAQLASAGSVNVTVKNTSASSSAASTFKVNAPAIASLTPATAVAGGAAFTLTVAGTNFVAGSTVMWGKTALATTYGSATSLTAAVTSTQLNSAGSVNITVANTSATASTASAIKVNGPAITSLSPNSAVAGSGDTTITITGTNFIAGSGSDSTFVAGSTAYLGTVPLTVTAGTATSITATVPAASMTSAGNLSVTVHNPGGAASTPSIFSIGAPRIASLTPATAAAGGADFTLTVAGTNFVTGSTVMWGTTALATTYGSATSLTAAVTSAQLASAGAVNVTIKNTSTSSSAASSFKVSAPAIASLTPATAAAGGAAFTLTVAGTNFIAGSTVMWGTTALATTYGSATSLTAAVTSAQLASAGSANVTVKNTSASSSAASSFKVNAPAIASLTPATAAAGGSAFTLTVAGTNFIAGSTVMWGTTALATTYGSATSLTAAVTSAQLASAGSANVTVKNTSTSSSTASAFKVNGPAITSLNPSTITAGSGDTMLTIAGTNFIAGTGSGSNFVAGSTVYLGATPLTVTAGTSTSIVATVPASAIAASGKLNVTVENTSSVISPASTLTVNAPKIASLSQTSIAAGASGFTLTVNGSGFVSGATVVWGTLSLTTVFVSSSQLTASVTAAEVANTNTVGIYVTNPGGSASAPTSFTVTAAPTIASLNPASATDGGAQFTLTVTGTNFVSGAKVMWDSTALATTYVSATKLTAIVPASAYASAATPNVTVVLPSGATTLAITFTVN